MAEEAQLPVVVPPDEQKALALATSAKSIVDEIEAMEITSQAQLDEATAKLDAIADLRKQVDDTLGKPKRVAHALWKMLGDRFKANDAPLERAAAKLRGKMGAYVQAEEQRLRIEAAKKAEAEKAAQEEQRIEEAAALEAAGEVETAQEVLDAPEMPAPVAPRAQVKSQGAAIGEAWKAEPEKGADGEITKAAKLKIVKAAAEGDVNALRVLTVHQPTLNKLVKALGKELEIPGVRVWSETTVKRTGR